MWYCESECPDARILGLNEQQATIGEIEPGSQMSHSHLPRQVLAAGLRLRSGAGWQGSGRSARGAPSSRRALTLPRAAGCRSPGAAEPGAGWGRPLAPRLTVHPSGPPRPGLPFPSRRPSAPQAPSGRRLRREGSAPRRRRAGRARAPGPRRSSRAGARAAGSRGGEGGWLGARAPPPPPPPQPAAPPAPPAPSARPQHVGS